MSCAPLATSRHRKGVLRGTPGGAEPPFTPTEMPCSAGAAGRHRVRSQRVICKAGQARQLPGRELPASPRCVDGDVYQATSNIWLQRNARYTHEQPHAMVKCFRPADVPQAAGTPQVGKYTIAAVSTMLCAHTSSPICQPGFASTGTAARVSPGTSRCSREC